MSKYVLDPRTPKSAEPARPAQHNSLQHNLVHCERVLACGFLCTCVCVRAYVRVSSFIVHVTVYFPFFVSVACSDIRQNSRLTEIGRDDFQPYSKVRIL